MNTKNLFPFAVILLFLGSCVNKSLTEGAEFRPKEIHSDSEFHFDMLEVDNVQYLILEKDNNNPHEGFGFMAFRANHLLMQQDSILAYLKSQQEMQVLIYAALKKIPVDQAQKEADELFKKNLAKYDPLLSALGKSKLNSFVVDRDSTIMGSKD